ncbi:MAG: FIST C-terminal domain-containing protein, partial [Gammaproteobacteria bacterium]|nr:FIST C-terminal domain-containing protein [Gammaproteobacteria bacterium]
NTVEGHWVLAAWQQLFSNAVVVSVLFPSVATAFAFHSGYSPTAVSGKATRAEGRVLHEIDGRAAADVYNEWTQGAVAGALAEGGNVLASTTLHPLGRVVGSVGGVDYFRLSHPDSLTADHAITLFSDIEEGDELVLMEGSVDSLVSRAGRVAQSALDAGKMSAEDISGALVVYCAGCMLTVQSEMDRVVEGLNQTLSGAPFLGNFTFGEQGCFVGGENRHGNLMISVVVFGK